MDSGAQRLSASEIGSHTLKTFGLNGTKSAQRLSAEEYGGYKVKDLIRTLEKICSPEGTQADRRIIATMDLFCKEYKIGVFSQPIHPNEVTP